MALNVKALKSLLIVFKEGEEGLKKFRIKQTIV